MERKLWERNEKEYDFEYCISGSFNSSGLSLKRLRHHSYLNRCLIRKATGGVKMKISREIKNHMENGSAYIDSINGADGIYTVRMCFSFGGRTGYEEYSLRTDAIPNLTDKELELASPNGKLELIIEQTGEINHFSVPRLEITRRLFRLPL